MRVHLRVFGPLERAMDDRDVNDNNNNNNNRDQLRQTKL